uniref:Uncharacterized protein n=1 Tax=Anguilla anguilla TaxID=7936 RepID=A0A0E9UH63_ANGAN
MHVHKKRLLAFAVHAKLNFHSVAEEPQASPSALRQQLHRFKVTRTTG